MRSIVRGFETGPFCRATVPLGAPARAMRFGRASYRQRDQTLRGRARRMAPDKYE